MTNGLKVLCEHGARVKPPSENCAWSSRFARCWSKSLTPGRDSVSQKKAGIQSMQINHLPQLPPRRMRLAALILCGFQQHT